MILDDKICKTNLSIKKDKIPNFDVSQMHINEILFEEIWFFAFIYRPNINYKCITELRKNEYTSFDKSNFIHIDKLKFKGYWRH